MINHLFDDLCERIMDPCPISLKRGVDKAESTLYLQQVKALLAEMALHLSLFVGFPHDSGHFR